MSIATTSEHLVCEWCDAPRGRHDHAGAYCSDACATRHRGAKLINQVKSDHRYCSTCYRIVKTTSPAKALTVPGPDYDAHPDDDAGPKNVADAIQFPTPNTTVGIDDFGRDCYDHLERTRWSCVCGAVNPNDSHGIIQATIYESAKVNLFNALVDAYRREAIDRAPTNQQAYLDAFRAPWRGAEYAVGMAVGE